MLVSFQGPLGHSRIAEFAPEELRRSASHDQPTFATISATNAESAFQAGVMAVVSEGGEISPGDPIRTVLPERPHLPLPPL